MKRLVFTKKEKEKINRFFKNIKQNLNVKNPKHCHIFLEKFKDIIEKKEKNLIDFYKIGKLIYSTFSSDLDQPSAYAFFKYFCLEDYFYIKKDHEIAAVASGRKLDKDIYFAYYILSNPKFRGKGFAKQLRLEQFEFLKKYNKYIFSEIKVPFPIKEDVRFKFHENVSKYKIILLPYFYFNPFNEEKFSPYFIGIRNLYKEENKIELGIVLNFISLAYMDYAYEEDKRLIYAISFRRLLKENIKTDFKHYYINLYNISEIFKNKKIISFINHVHILKQELEKEIEVYLKTD